MKKNKYDALLNYLRKHGEIPVAVAIDMLAREYSQRNTAYGTLDSLIKQQIIEKVFHDKAQWIRLRVQIFPMPERMKEEVIELNVAILYPYFVRYGAQHFSAPGRVKFMSIMGRYVERYRRQYQFAQLLIDLLDADVSKAEFIAMHESLKEAGWYDKDYDAADITAEVTAMIRPVDRTNYLGLSDADWDGLDALDDLGRIKEAEERLRTPPPQPNTVNRSHYYQQLMQLYGIDYREVDAGPIYDEWRKQHPKEH